VIALAVWLTSDWHFCHDRGFIYQPRGFKTVEEANETILQNHNALVKPDDEVFVLGDLMLNDTASTIEALKMLTGRLHIIVGNHDTDRRLEIYSSLPNVVEVTMAKRLRYKKFHFWLSHYPTLCSNYDDDKPLYARVINLCGHSHTFDPFEDWDKGLIYHCELDAHNNRPVLIDDIIAEIKLKISEPEICISAESVI
jgi:calcineurin-like phosphoesterase family protein